MFDITPFQNWLHFYNPYEDERSMYYLQEREGEEMMLQVYNYIISPYWDDFGSRTLYCKVLFVDYDEHAAIIELVGEWNDAIENDIMYLKRQLVDSMLSLGIFKFIIIGENVLNFHSSDLNYYEEWMEDIQEQGGFIVCLNFPEQSKQEMISEGLSPMFFFLEYDRWRTHDPLPFFEMIENRLLRLIS